jgi:methionyl aminopeptidase
MSQPPKTPEQIQAMREGGKILARVFAELRQYVAPGITGLAIDDYVGTLIAQYGAFPTYRSREVNFPGNICISVNDQIVHGVPTARALSSGDIVSFDLVITYKEMKTDSAFTMVVGEAPSGAVKHLLRNTERSLMASIDAIKGPCRTSDIGAAIEQVLETAKLGIIRELVGHGVGQSMHMPPEVPNYRTRATGEMLKVGDTIAIEPMATLGGETIITEDDGWTISTRDGSLSAHFEHTVLITENSADILTLA